MSWGADGGAEVVEKWCIWCFFSERVSSTAAYQWGSEGVAKWSSQGGRGPGEFGPRIPTPDPNWESLPGTPLVIFLGGWGGGRIPLGARGRRSPTWGGYQA